jgi:hypothetical protein
VRLKRHVLSLTAPGGLAARTRATILSAIALAVAAGAASAVPITTAAQVPASVSFVVGNIPATLANGHWELETGEGNLGLKWITLSSGTIPTGGGLTIPIALDTAMETVNDHFMLVMSLRIDQDHAYLGNALVGFPKTHLVAGAAINLTPIVNEVPVYHDAASAAGATSCPSCVPSDNPGGVLAPGNTAPSTAARPPAASTVSIPSVDMQNNAWTVMVPYGAAHPGGDNVGLPIPCIGPPSDCYGPLGPYVGPVTGGSGSGLPNPPSTCPVTDGCVTANEVPQANGSCNNYNGLEKQSSDCVTDSYDFSAETFRGWSNKVPGDTDVYMVHNDYEQSWENGYRTQRGPFSSNGNTSESYSGGSDITYQKRGDCWSPTQSGDDNPSLCTGTGWDANLGQDTWRWERHTTRTCYSGGGCNDQSVYEVLFPRTFNGGNDVSYQNSTVGDDVRPGIITNSGYGPDWARWNPDTSKETRLGSSATVQNGVSIDVNFTHSFGGTYSADGGQMYEGSETDTKYANQGNLYTFRGPASGLPWMGYFFNYDGNHRPWQWEYWTCQFNNGYVGAMNETELYQGNTQCWDASQ